MEQLNYLESNIIAPQKCIFPTCKQVCKNSFALSLHLKEHQKKSTKCTTCNILFLSTDDLAEHLISNSHRKISFAQRNRTEGGIPLRSENNGTYYSTFITK